LTTARRARITPKDVAVLVVTFAVLAVIVFPFLWVVVTSLRTEDTLFTNTFSVFPELPSLESYRSLLDSGFGRHLLNSLIVCVPACVFAVLFSLFAAYAFSRRAFPGRDALLLTVIFSQIFPFVVLVTPLYAIFFRVGLVNSLFGLGLIYVAITIPFSVYMLVGYINSVPRALDEAAIMDGCSTLGVIFRVVLPVAWPGVIATAIYAFTQAWNEYLFALAFMTGDERKTVPVWLASFFGEYSTRWDMVMAASVMAVAPALLFFLFLQRYLVAGLAAGSVKE
jgi:ABC-type glycerol-3-phosphate transport system permease component